MFGELFNRIRNYLLRADFQTGLILMKIAVRIQKKLIVKRGLTDLRRYSTIRILDDITLIENELETEEDSYYCDAIRDFLYSIEFDRYLLLSYVE